jgi:hypothetical protein
VKLPSLFLSTSSVTVVLTGRTKLSLAVTINCGLGSTVLVAVVRVTVGPVRSTSTSIGLDRGLTLPLAVSVLVKA